MNYLIQGSALPLNWFRQRLLARGMPATLQPSMLLKPLPFDWQGCLVSDSARYYWLDTPLLQTSTWQQRRDICQQDGIEFIELNGQWQDLGLQFGFMLFTGYQQTYPLEVQALLDALAPMPKAWLPCGPPGSAHYTRQVWDALFFMLRAGLLGLGRPDSCLHWEDCWLQQWELYKNLEQLSRQYLTAQKLSVLGGNVVADFSVRPQQQPHYAANLARLIISLGDCNEIWQRLVQLKS
ncbi:hypothetical protein HZU77_000425 [Neisseriaceae bacterium TC5R-5]|nr:hypothetical protein [Neisseriaceae bacterium TC5R-5]